jgi:Skp family chaperone for outer membrane proteins
MKTTWTLVMTGVAVSALCLFVGYRSTQAQSPGPAPRYGVVDLAEVMRRCADVEELKNKLEARAEKFKHEGQSRQQKIEDLRFQRDQKHPDSPDWFKIQKELNRLSVELELWTKFEKQDIQSETQEQQSNAYKMILEAVDTVCKQRGLEMAFQLDRVQLNDPNDLVSAQRMAIRAVIFASPTIDLTKEVVARVNQVSGTKTQDKEKKEKK